MESLGWAMAKGERFSVYMDSIVLKDAKKYAKEKKISLSQAVEDAMIKAINHEWTGAKKYLDAIDNIDEIVKKTKSTQDQ